MADTIERPEPPPAPCQGSCAQIDGHLGVIVQVSGVVTDPRGTPLADARVYWSDPQHHAQAVTDEDGRYTIPVKADRSVELIADHDRYFWATHTVADPLTEHLQPVDFALPHILFATVDPKEFDNRPAQQITIAAETTADPATSTLRARIDTGEQVELALVGPSATRPGFDRFEAQVRLQTGLDDGRYAIEVCGLDAEATGTTCDDPQGLVLTQIDITRVHIDSIAPTVDALTLSPGAGSQTAEPDRPLQVHITDEGTGVVAAGITFHLIDVTDPDDEQITALPAGYDPATGWATSSPPGLQVGGLYRIGAEVTDLAGNRTDVVQASPFAVITAEALAAEVWIPETECEVSDEIDLATQTKEVTCEGVVVHVGQSSLEASAVHNGGGWTFVGHEVPLGQAELSTVAAGVRRTQPAYASGLTHSFARPIEVPSRQLNPTTIAVPPEQRTLPRLTARVPATWTDATIRLPASSAPGRAEVCLVSGVAPCSSDPLDAHVTVHLSPGLNSVDDLLAEHVAEYGVVPDQVDPNGASYTAWVSRSVRSLMADDHRVLGVAETSRGGSLVHHPNAVGIGGRDLPLPWEVAGACVSCVANIHLTYASRSTEENILEVLSSPGPVISAAIPGEHVRWWAEGQAQNLRLRYRLDLETTGNNSIAYPIHSGEFVDVPVVNLLEIELMYENQTPIAGAPWTLTLLATAATPQANLIAGISDQDGSVAVTVPDTPEVRDAAAANDGVVNTILWMSGNTDEGDYVCPDPIASYWDFGSDNEGIQPHPASQVVMIPIDHPICTEECRDGPMDLWVTEDLDPAWGKIARIHSVYGLTGSMGWERKASADFQVGTRGSGGLWEARGWAHVGNTIATGISQPLVYSGTDASTGIVKAFMRNAHLWMQREDWTQPGQCFVWEETHTQEWLSHRGFKMQLASSGHANNSCAGSCTAPPPHPQLQELRPHQTRDVAAGTGLEIGGALCVGRANVWQFCAGGRGNWAKSHSIGATVGDECSIWYVYDTNDTGTREWFADAGVAGPQANQQGVPSGCA